MEELEVEMGLEVDGAGAVGVLLDRVLVGSRVLCI